MSKSNSPWSFIITVIIAFLIVDNLLKRNKIEQLQREINDNESINTEIRTKLTELIQNNKEVDPKIASELRQIVELLEIKQNNTAIFKLTKIIENLLKELFDKSDELIALVRAKGKKSPSFADYLEHAQNQNVISLEDYHLLIVMKSIRNGEAHELATNPHRTKIFAAFIAGLGLILGLCRLLNKKTLKSE